MLPRIFWGSIQVCPFELISHKTYLSSEIGVVDNKCSLRQGVVDTQFLKVVLKSSRPLATYERFQFQHFFMILSELPISS
jgi:hypothetical protein